MTDHPPSPPSSRPGDLTGDWNRRVWRLAGPIILANLSTPLLGAVDVATMRQANYAVDRQDDKWPPERAAQWLLEQIAP